MRNITGQSMALKILAVLLAVGFLAGFLLFLFRGEQEDNTQEAANSKAGTEDADAKKPTDEGKEQDKDKKNGEKKDDPKAKDKDAKKDKKKKDPPPVPDFDTPKLSVLPFDTSAQSRVFEQGIKPGHWTAAIVEMKANNFDFAGELDCTLFNNDGRPIQLPGLPYQMVSRRPVVLPKGQKKFFEAVFYPAPPNDGKGPKLHARLLGRAGGEVQAAPFDPLALMPAHQYFFVVLANPLRDYSFLKIRESISPQASGDFPEGPNSVAHYRVSIPQAQQRVPLPPHFLAWTNIAYVLWDDINPDVLVEEQKQALIDWLHWGGQLIISGPDSLAALQTPGGFLEPFLPATAGDSLQIDEGALETINENWAILNDTTRLKNRLKPVKPWAGVRLLPRDDSEEVRLTGKLLYERRVGRGRIVVSSFSLSAADLKNWPSYDSFLNACLLRRPPRNFVEIQQNASIETRLIDAAAWTGDSTTGEDPFNPAVNTNVRLLGRDAARSSEKSASTRVPADGRLRGTPYRPNNVPDPDEMPPPDGGVGEWSDFNPVSSVARKSLIAAAGIEIPTASFVIGCLAAYLAVLVPVNWALFRLIGKVEWAWFAAPFLAIAGTIFVTKMAHLDIGFTRSEREVALVEMHAGHSRAHVTRYTALYTSLSSSYRLTCDDPSVEALPFSSKPTPESYRMLLGQGLSEIEIQRGEQTGLSGLGISSNTTGMIHSEQLAKMGGSFQWKKKPGSDGDLENGTDLDLHSAGVLRKINGQIKLAWIGELPRHTSKSLKFEDDRSRKVAGDLSKMPSAAKAFAEDAKPEYPLRKTEEDPVEPEPATKSITEPFFPDGKLAPEAFREIQWSQGGVLRELFALLSNEEQFRNGETRLFGWTDQPIPGPTIDPVAAQSLRASLVVVQLGYANFPAPRRDNRLRPIVRPN